MTTTTRKIGFLLGSPDINGGTYVIYEHASRLQDAGHQVAIITQAAVRPERYGWHPAAGRLEWLTLAEAGRQEFDVILATWWQSPFLLQHLSAAHFAYFVQSIESRFFAEEDPRDHDKRDLSILKKFCERTYSYALPVITEAAWIREYLHDNYNSTPILVRNGIRKDLYLEHGECAAPRVEGRLRVLVEGPVDVSYKNVPRSVELCRRAGVDEVWLLTSSEIRDFPGVDRVFSRVPIDKTPEIYRSCDVLVKLSYIEGMFGPPLEMFHCGGTAIVYHVTGHDEYIVHDHNSLVVDRDDEDQVVACLRRLKNDPGTLKRLQRGAAATAGSWPGWEASSAEFDRALQVICRQEKTTRNYLAQQSARLVEEKNAALAARDLEFFAGREKNQGTAEESIDNFVQLYWNKGDGFNLDDCQWLYYKSGTRVDLSFEVDITGFPFWLRIDPSVRMGLIEIYCLEVFNQRTGRKIMEFSRPADFDVLYMDGTICRLQRGGPPVYLATGSDPQLVLPAVEEGEPGDTLRIVLSLRETGVRQFIDEYCPATGRPSLGRRLAAGLSSIFPAGEK